MTSEPDTAPAATKRLGWLGKTLIAALCLAVLVAVLVLSIPSLLSTDSSRQALAGLIEKQTGLPTQIKSLHYGWSDGLRLEGVSIGVGGPKDERFLCSVDKAHVGINIPALFSRRAEVFCSLQGLTLRHVLLPKEDTPTKPLPELLQQLFHDMHDILRSRSIPFEFSLHIDIKDTNLYLPIPASNATLEILHGSFNATLPSLKNGTFGMHSSFTPVVNDNTLDAVNMSADITNFTSASGILQPLLANVSVNATAKGIHASIAGSVQAGLSAQLSMQLSTLTRPLAPLLAGKVPELSGEVTVHCAATAQDEKALNVVLGLTTENLTAAGSLLGRKSLGPITLQLNQKANLVFAAGNASIPGDFSINGSGPFVWTGEVSGLENKAPVLRLALQQASINLGPVLSSLHYFLPPGLRLGAARLHFDKLSLLAAFTGKTDAPPSVEASVHGLALDVSRLALPQADKTITVAAVNLNLDALNVVIPSLALGGGAGTDPKPALGHLEVLATAHVTGVAMTGASPLSLQSAQVSRLNLALASLSVDPSALFGVTGTLTVHKEAELTGLLFGGNVSIPKIHQNITASATLPASKQLTASIGDLTVNMPVVRAKPKGKPAIETPLNLRVAVPEIRLLGPAPLTKTIRDASVKVDVGDVLQADVVASLTGQTGQDVATKGMLKANMGKLGILARPFLPKSAQLSGSAQANWTCTATLPKQSPSTATALTLRQKLDSLRMLHELNAVVDVHDIAVVWPQKDGTADPLRLRGISTPRPLHITTRNGMADATLNGSLSFGPLAALPGVGALGKPVSGLLTINAAQQNARSLQLTEMLKVDGFGLEQNLNLTLDKMDALLEGKTDIVSALLDSTDGTADFSLRTGLDGLPAKSTRGMHGKGKLTMNAQARLSGGRSLFVTGRLASPGLDLALGPDTAIAGLHSDLTLTKRYVLGFGPGCGSTVDTATKPLSEYVFDQLPAARSILPSPDSFALRSLYGQQDTRGPGSFGFRSLTLRSGPLPLSLSDVNMNVDTSGPLPIVRSSRLGVFGGGVLGSAKLRGGTGHYTLEADCAFTGIDAARMLPGKGKADFGDQAEISGRVNMALPLTANAETFLRQMRLRADITKIGPHTLERMLYALDPNEQNETIVQQRRMMDIGYPRNLRLGIDYGSLSLSGQVVVKGFQLDLPQIDRLAVGNLALGKDLNKTLAPVPALVKMLDTISTSRLCRGTPQGSKSPHARTNTVQ